MDASGSANSYNEDEAAPTVPLSWLLRRPALGLRPVHLSDGDPGITWAHAIELDDPTPFLRGGELVLTTGLRLPRAGALRSAYVDRLVGAGAAALGLGTGLRHAQVPAGVRRACAAADLPLVEVPLATPFMAVSQAIADRLGELRRLRLTETMDQQRALSRAAVRGGVVAVVRTVARQLGAGVYLCDRTWRELSRAGAAQGLPERLEALLDSGRRGAVSEASLTGWAEVQPVGERPVGRLGWLVLGRTRPLSVPERLVLTHAVSLVLLLLDRPEGAVPEAEADLVRLLLDSGDVPSAAMAFGAGGAVCVVVARGPRHRLFPAVEETRRSAPQAIRAEVTADARMLVVDDEVEGVVANLLDALGTDGRVGIGPAVGVAEAASTLTAARRACETAEPGTARRSADLPVTTLLTQPAVRDAVASTTAGLLSALHDSDLTESLASFLAHHGSWDRTAADLGVHRHTVRHRMRKVEELTGLSLDDPEHRVLLHLGVLSSPGRR
jgi:PucR family transcriptional regulator, purine catabolism regulatory protein